jgi:6-pyruvoyltetrahydropterin/6-carboxytetrahydropterin synthase
MFTITKRFAFSASHVLDTLGPDHPCARLHGHNYEVEVVRGGRARPPRASSSTTELAPTRSRASSTTRSTTATSTTCMPEPPSSERLAWWLYEWAKGNLPSDVAAALSAVRVSETPRTWAEYRPREP